MRRKHHQRGFIIFFGWRGVKGSDGSTPVETICPLCREKAVLRGRVIRRWFTLFFVPVFPVQSVAQGFRFTQCSACKREINGTIEQLARRAPAEGVTDHQTAIRLYNQLRDQPDDAAKLLDLVRVYVSTGDIRDAEAACKMFPAAYTKDPTIEQTLRTASA